MVGGLVVDVWKVTRYWHPRFLGKTNVGDEWCCTQPPDASRATKDGERGIIRYIKRELLRQAGRTALIHRLARAVWGQGKKGREPCAHIVLREGQRGNLARRLLVLLTQYTIFTVVVQGVHTNAGSRCRSARARTRNSGQIVSPQSYNARS